MERGVELLEAQPKNVLSWWDQEACRPMNWKASDYVEKQEMYNNSVIIFIKYNEISIRFLSCLIMNILLYFSLVWHKVLFRNGWPLAYVCNDCSVPLNQVHVMKWAEAAVLILQRSRADYTRLQRGDKGLWATYICFTFRRLHGLMGFSLSSVSQQDRVPLVNREMIRLATCYVLPCILMCVFYGNLLEEQ
jgi:hypothetical protein